MRAELHALVRHDQVAGARLQAVGCVGAKRLQRQACRHGCPQADAEPRVRRVFVEGDESEERENYWSLGEQRAEEGERERDLDAPTMVAREPEETANQLNHGSPPRASWRHAMPSWRTTPPRAIGISRSVQAVPHACLCPLSGQRPSRRFRRHRQWSAGGAR